jgi:hypothetical protein
MSKTEDVYGHKRNPRMLCVFLERNTSHTGTALGLDCGDQDTCRKAGDKVRAYSEYRSPKNLRDDSLYKSMSLLIVILNNWIHSSSSKTSSSFSFVCSNLLDDFKT